MTTNEYIKLRITELEGRLRVCQGLVMNKQMRVEEKLIRGQIVALQAKLEAEVIHGDPVVEHGDPKTGELITRGGAKQQSICGCGDPTHCGFLVPR